MADAAARRTIDSAVASAAVDGCLNWRARGDANISKAGGTLLPRRRCQPIPKRSGIGDPPQSAAPHDQIYLRHGDILAVGSGCDCVAGLCTCRESRRGCCARQGGPAGYSRRCKLRRPDLAEHRIIMPARYRIGCNHSRGAPGHGAPLSRI
jgi:hypothetical protein